MTSVKEKYLSLKHASIEFIRYVTGGGDFSNANYLLVLREERLDRQKNRDDVNDAKFEGLVRDFNTTYRHLIPCNKITGCWVNIRFTTVTGTVLGATLFHGFL